MDEQKKNILFVCYGLGIGGIEKCLVNLLNALPEDQYEVDILLMNPEYAMKPQIRRHVQYLDTFRYVLNIEDTISEIKKMGGFFHKIGMLLSYICFRFRIKMRLPAWKVFKPLPKRYDIAVAYSQNGFAPYYVIDMVQATRKVLWYHNGAYEKVGQEYSRDKLYYSCFDHIVAVSSDCAKVLRDKFDFEDEKILVLSNICDAENIRHNALEFSPDSFSCNFFHIVTVGRMTSEKGANLALEACRQLAAEGRNICWHWVGDGNQSEKISAQVADLGLQEHFKLEGNQTNPYPYINAADVYVQPSYYEAYSTTITEARVLAKPIITTDVGGMRDQLTDGVTGLIVPIDAGAIADAVRRLMDDKELRISFCEKLKEESFDPDCALTEYQKTVFR